MPGTSTYAPLGYLLHDVARLMRRRFDEHARNHQLTLPQWRALAQLAHSDSLSQVTLAGLVEADPMTLSGIIDRMEAKNLVERVPDPDDNRAKLIRLTPEGRALVEQMKELAGPIRDRAMAGISDQDIEATIRTLSRIRENLNSQPVPVKEMQ
ncbi:MarR family transcriptional regulator [Youhaiella tibetensis]|uniref:MarR family transcriptional regulator n=1 Tax=Paradevosia tibetensis TaxID=1447062 RepID=A0A5B9DL48_9HYPH|nr:MarR family transcriptional regulator [Youhaiella tibetensis]AKR58500.1 MarR family transcriptional regulator [Devosia sp. H5989]QEE19379.1 MarR family transcriptional regulator [Youhaiella tibetensis]GGF33701.1 MarR family transcriptional regulator [Youhaiella tibetensis]